MKFFCAFALSFLVVLGGLPLTVRADAPDVFSLPDGRVAESYRADIEAVLSNNYRLKVETGMKESILQWAVVEGELPPGLTVRSDGSIVGTPTSQRDSPYRIRVRVIDASVKNAEPLEIRLSISVLPARLRLARISGPTLVPVESRFDGSNERTVAPREDVVVNKDSASTRGTESMRRPMSPIGEAASLNVASNNSSNAPESNRSISRPTKNRGFVAKAAGLLGLGQGQDRGDGRARGRGSRCDSSGHTIVSDEAHTPLTKDTSNRNTCVEFINMNTLKYRYEFNEERTTTAGPDISSLPFLPKVSLTAATATTSPATPNALLTPTFHALIQGVKDQKAKDDIGNKLTEEIVELSRRFQDARQSLSRVETKLRNRVEMEVNNTTARVQDAHARSKGLASGADLYLQSSNIAQLLGEVAAVKAKVDEAMLLQWPTENINEVLSALDDVTTELEDLRVKEDGTLVSQDAWKEWLAANEGRYNRVRDRIPELKTKVNTIIGGEAAFAESKVILAAWQLVIDNVNSRQASAFTQQAFVSCHNDEGENQSSKLTLTKNDRTATSQPATSREVITVSCYSRVAITAGFNFSTLDEKEFSVVQSAGATPGSVEKKFGFTSSSSFRPNPLALVNVRFTNKPNINWHASFGAVVDLKGQTGTDVEPVAGVSFSIRRLIFITPFALHFGRVNKLAGGFEIGDSVPDAVATPPVEKAWKVGYTSGVTFRIGP